MSSEDRRLVRRPSGEEIEVMASSTPEEVRQLVSQFDPSVVTADLNVEDDGTFVFSAPRGGTKGAL